MASKFKFNLEITGFKLEVEGTREDVASIPAIIGNQFGNLMQAKGLIPSKLPNTIDGEAEEIEEPKQNGSKKGRSKRKPGSGTTKGKSADMPEFRNDPVKYGTPNQSWKLIEKSLWILYVVKQETRIAELTPGQIANIFNKHFQQAKTIRASHVSKELGTKKYNKGDSKALVGDNPNASPTTWYLLEEGDRFVQSLIAQQLAGNGTH